MAHKLPHKCDHSPELTAILADVFAVDDMRELDLFRRLNSVAHLLRHLAAHYRKGDPFSAARMRLLTRLVVATRLGSEEGLSPSELSRFLGVSRNTVSALLNGLESQGLVERHLHPYDRRQFLIRITPEGAALVHTRAPEYAAFVADLFAALSPVEQGELLGLLDKLFGSLVDRASGMEVTGSDPDLDPSLEDTHS